MPWAVKKKIGCCFSALTASTHRAYTVLKKVFSEFVIT